MPNQNLSIGDAVSVGWQIAKQNVLLVMGISLVALAAPMVPSFIADELSKAGDNFAILSLLFGLASFGIGIVTSIGIISIALKFINQQKPRVAEVFTTYRYFFRYCVASVLFSLMVMLGLIFLIIPGLILAIRCGMYGYFIIDQNLGPVDALKASFRITKGKWWSLTSIYLTLGLINLVGFLALLVGYLFTYMVAAIAVAYVYKVLVAGEVGEYIPEAPIAPLPPPLPPVSA